MNHGPVSFAFPTDESTSDTCLTFNDLFKDFFGEMFHSREKSLVVKNLTIFPPLFFFGCSHPRVIDPPSNSDVLLPGFLLTTEIR